MATRKKFKLQPKPGALPTGPIHRQGAGLLLPRPAHGAAASSLPGLRVAGAGSAAAPQYTIKQGDALQLLADMEPGSVDAVICDPPYGCTRNKWDSGIDLQQFWNALTPILNKNTPACIFSQQPFTTDLIASNRKMFRYDIIWHKQIQVGFLNARKMPLRAHEQICIFYGKLPVYNPQKYYRDSPSWRGKGTRQSCNYGKYAELPSTGSKDGSRYPGSIVYIDYEPLFFKKSEFPRHPTQKPLGIMEYLVKTYTNPGGVVLDPFMGSGTTGVAALALGRKFIGFEREPEYFAVAEKRISEAAHV